MLLFIGKIPDDHLHVDVTKGWGCLTLNHVLVCLTNDPCFLRKKSGGNSDDDDFYLVIITHVKKRIKSISTICSDSATSITIPKMTVVDTCVRLTCSMPDQSVLKTLLVNGR